MSKASARRMRRKAHKARLQAIDAERYNAWHGVFIAAQPLPSTLVPIATWQVQVREGFTTFCYQTFAAMPAEGDKVWLCTNPKRGSRRIGQWPFDTWQQAMAYSQQVYKFNGCALRA